MYLNVLRKIPKLLTTSPKMLLSLWKKCQLKSVEIPIKSVDAVKLFCKLHIAIKGIDKPSTKRRYRVRSKYDGNLIWRMKHMSWKRKKCGQI